MKKYLNILVSLVLMTAALNGFSQQSNANALIKKMVKTFRDPKNVEVSYDYCYQEKGKSPEKKQQGKAYMEGERYKIVMNEQETISDGKVIWTYLVEEQEAMVSDAGFGDDNTPFKLITTLDRDYTATLIETNEKRQSVVQLTNPEGRYPKVIVRIAKDGSLDSAEIEEAGGGMLTIEVKDLKVNQTFDDAFFSFDEKAHPDVEIIDMR